MSLSCAGRATSHLQSCIRCPVVPQAKIFRSRLPLLQPGPGSHSEGSAPRGVHLVTRLSPASADPRTPDAVRAAPFARALR